MPEKKNLSEDELSNVNGGGGSEDTPMIACSDCGELYSPYSSQSRSKGSGCDADFEYKCPNCGSWHKLD